MNFQTKEIGNVIVIYLNGRLDSSFSKEIVVDVFKIFYNNEKYHFIFNLKNVEFMSSNGIKIILNAKDILHKNNKKIKLCCLSEPVKNVASVIELSSIVETYDSEEEALQSFAI